MKLLDNHQKRTGIGFGITSAVVTTLGLMVGVHSSTHSFLAVIGGVISIALADAFSDALGIHISEESEGVHSKKEVWWATFFTLITKLSIGLTFVVPLLIFELSTAVWVSVTWGLFLLAGYTFVISRKNNESPYRPVIEHLALAVFVVILTNYIGSFIGGVFL